MTAPAANAATATTKRFVTQRASKVTTRKLHWLWPERVPLSKITTFAGLPGEGKSLVTIDIAARLSTGRPLPDAPNPFGGKPVEVLFIASEDDAEDALGPRLDAAGADRDKIHIHKTVLLNEGTAYEKERTLALDTDIESILQLLTANPNIRAVVIDPVTNHLGQASMNNEGEIRALLTPFQALPGVAVIQVAHLNKKSDLAAIHRVGGAGAFIGLARASWLFARDGGGVHHMLPLKNNYMKETVAGLQFEIRERKVALDEGGDMMAPYIEWTGPSNASADQILAPVTKRELRESAREFLGDFLKDGPRDQEAVLAGAKAQGISEKTLRRAKTDLGVESRKKGVVEGWEWALTPCPSLADVAPG
jgi:putative DNA primase/helicase